MGNAPHDGEVPNMTDLWRMAEAALPPRWVLQGLRCGSTGLEAAQRADSWVAEACGPGRGCVRIEAGMPDEALGELAVRLRAIPATRDDAVDRP